MPSGHKIVVDAKDENRLRISTSPSVLASITTDRADDFAKATKIGTVMGDGTIYGGVSPTSKLPFFIPSKEHVQSLSTKKMEEFIGTADCHGHHDWQLASFEEGEHLLRHRHLSALSPIFDHGGRTYRVVDGQGAYQAIRILNGQLLTLAFATARKSFVMVRYGKPDSPHA